MRPARIAVLRGGRAFDLRPVELEDRIEWSMSSNVVLRWVVALGLTAAIGLLAYYLTPDFSTRPDVGQVIMGGGLLLLGVVVVVCALVWAVNAFRAARLYGNATLELETVPVPIGGRLRGRIRADATLAPDQAINLILQCEESDLGGGESGGGSRVRWESEHLLTANDVQQAGGNLLAHVDLDVPGGQPPTGNEGRHGHSWLLIASFEPSSGYAPRFPLTVLRTAESPPASEREPEPTIGVVGVMQKIGQLATYAQDGTLAEAAAAWHQDEPTQRPPHARVEVLPRASGGVEVVLPKSKGALVSFIWFFLTLPLWIVLPAWGFADLRAIESPPLIAYLLYYGLGFGAPLLLNGLGALSVIWQTRSLQVGTDGVIVQRVLGRRTHPAGKFTTAAALGNTTQGWSVHLEETETSLFGRLQVVALQTQSEARWLAAEVRQALGVKPPAPFID